MLKHLDSPETIEDQLYITKYTPCKLEEMVGNRDIVQLFMYYLRVKKFPNIILIGPTGTGKNLMAKLFVRELLGNYFQTHCLEIDGSLYRGRCVINQSNDVTKINEKSAPNILNFLKRSLPVKDVKKIVIIYDFDYITSETQMALRRVMEENQNVRFIFLCNSRDAISETVQSRSNIYILKPLTDDDLIQVIANIISRENLNILPEVVASLVKNAEGNIRMAINTLQLISRTEKLDLERFYQIINLPATFQVEHLFLACLAGHENEAIGTLDSLIENGYSLVDLLNLMLRTVVNSDKFSVPVKNDIIEIISCFFLLNETSLTLTNIYCLIYRLLTISSR